MPVSHPKGTSVTPRRKLLRARTSGPQLQRLGPGSRPAQRATLTPPRRASLQQGPGSRWFLRQLACRGRGGSAPGIATGARTPMPGGHARVRRPGRRDGDDGTLGMGQAVTAHLGEAQPPQRAPAAGAHDQHIVWADGQVDQHPARRSALDVRLHQRIAGGLSPDCHQRVPELLAGQVPARLPRFARRPGPVGVVTARQFPGDNRDQERIVLAG